MSAAVPADQSATPMPIANVRTEHSFDEGAQIAQFTYFVAVRRQFLDHLSHWITGPLSHASALLSMVMRHPEWEWERVQNHVASATSYLEQTAAGVSAFETAFKSFAATAPGGIEAFVAAVTPPIAAALQESVDDLAQRVLHPEPRDAKTMPTSLDELQAVDTRATQFLQPRLANMSEQATSLAERIRAVRLEEWTAGDGEGLRTDIRTAFGELTATFGPVARFYSIWRFHNYRELLSFDEAEQVKRT